MNIEVKGKIHAIGEKKSGVSRMGNSWQRIDYVLTWEAGNYVDHISLSAMNNDVSAIESFGVGAEVEVSAHITAREYNGRWYNDIMTDEIKSASPKPVAAPEPKSKGQPKAEAPEEGDDLPF